MKMSYAAARNDAGFLREYITRHYGSTFRYGGSPTSWRMGLNLVKRLARMVKQTPAKVQAQIIQDWEVSQG